MRIEVEIHADRYTTRISDGMELYGRTMVRTPTGAKGHVADGCKSLSELEDRNYELYCIIDDIENMAYDAMRCLEDLDE